MSTTYNVLSHTRLNKAVSIMSPPHAHGAVLTLDSPAIYAMTDLSQVRPVMASPSLSINQANGRMITYGVRMLFVTDSDEQMIGIITATDVLGEKSIQYMNKVGCTHDEIEIRDIMTDISNLEVLSQKDVERAHVGDILETLKDVSRQHALVIDGESQKVSGIFSTAHISRMMNVRIEVPEVATTFAAVQSALS